MSGLNKIIERFKKTRYLFSLLFVLAAAGLFGVFYHLHVHSNYITAHTKTLYAVNVQQQSLGFVTSPDIVNQYIEDRQTKLNQHYPDLQMVLDAGKIQLSKKKVLNGKADNAAVLKQLDSRLTSHAKAVAIKMKGQVIGYVKDQQTAENVLSQIKKHLISATNHDSAVHILSASMDSEIVSENIMSKKIDFVQTIQADSVQIDPDQISNPDEMVQQLETGGVQRKTYTVQQGDCVSCIAQKFNISNHVIYDNNPSIKNDVIHVGDVLDVTVYHPLVSIKTVEQMKETINIPYLKEYKEDKKLLKGVEQVVKPGKDGQKIVTLELTKVNGKVIDSKEISDTVIQNPVTAQILKGTKVISGLGTGHLIWPVSKHLITRGFGWEKAIFVTPNAEGNEYHEGLDIVSRVGDRNIEAADNGKVSFTGQINGYGNCIKIDHLNGLVTFYAHLNKIYVHVGQVVEKGQKVGYMGETGWATGIHLHFGILHHGKWVNPLNYLNK